MLNIEGCAAGKNLLRIIVFLGIRQDFCFASGNIRNSVSMNVQKG